MARSKDSQDGASASAALLKLKLSRFKRLEALCSSFVIFSLVAAGFFAYSSSRGEAFMPVLGTNLVTGSSTLRVEEQEWTQEAADDCVCIQHVVALPEELLLLIKTPALYSLPKPEDLRCVFSNKTITRVRGLDTQNRKSTIRCELPVEKVGVRTEVSLIDLNSRTVAPGLRSEVRKWNSITFEAVSTPQDVVLFAKGVMTKRAQVGRVKDLKCVFGDGTETKVTSAAQEVFRCEHPKHRRLTGKKVSLKVHGSLMPSVAVYEQMRSEVASTRKYFLCSCTMVFNVAKFLREWVFYHSRLGVERFFFYDNNSEDDIKQVLDDLKEYNVSRHFWPWIKAQEAGFSHCALRARHECTWMVYTDVDEFIFPKAWLSKNPPPLKTMVEEMSTRYPKQRSGILGLYSSAKRKKVGQIFVGCRVFGPSGLQKHPVAGVTQGYICRTRKLQRHKSIVLLDALDDSLLNVVHHFQLRPGYVNTSISAWKGVIDHYKYQVWNEFKTKFRRRVSAYVSDWKEEKNMDSKDRTPGLGTEEVEPTNWKRMFCVVNDTELRDYAFKTFATRDINGFRKMAWQ